MAAKQSVLQLLQEREQQLSAITTVANTSKQQVDQLQRCGVQQPRQQLCASCGSACQLCIHMLQADTPLPDNCSETRTLVSQLATLQEQYKRSQAAQQESESQLAAARAKLKAAEELAASQSSRSAQLQQGLTAAESELKKAQQAAREAWEEVKRQVACKVEQGAPAHTEAEVRLAGRHTLWLGQAARLTHVDKQGRWGAHQTRCLVSCRSLHCKHSWQLHATEQKRQSASSRLQRLPPPLS